MKLRSTTPASNSLFTRVVLLSIAGLFAILIPIQITSKPVAADQYDEKMKALQQTISSYKTQAAALNAQAKTLSNELQTLSVEKASIQAQLDLSQTEYDKLVTQIADTEKKIEDNRDALGETIADLYVDDQITPLEMLASSKNISDFLDKQEYRSSVRDQLTNTIAEIKDLKTQLEQQKDRVKVVLDRQTAQRNELAAKEAERQNLLNQTQGQESQYNALVAATQKALDDVARQQRDYYQSLVNSGHGTAAGVYGSFQWRNLNPPNAAGGCTGGYPYCMAQDTFVDPWRLYNRECVSYVAWALENRFGKYVAGFNGEGNAYEWAFAHYDNAGRYKSNGSAIEYSGAYRVYNPQPGDVVVLPKSSNFAPVGHVMIVESVSGDWMHVSQYNFFGTGQYSTMDVKNAGVALLRFNDR